MVNIIFDTVYTVISIVEFAALVSIFLSWIMPYSRIRMTIDWLLSPLVAPFRMLNMKLMSRFNIPLDFSYFFFFIGLNAVSVLLTRLHMMLI